MSETSQPTREQLKLLVPLMDAARRALDATPYRLGTDPNELLAAIVIAISAELSGPSNAVLSRMKQAETERDRILRIVSDWCIEANNIGGIDAGDLAWWLEEAGYPLPDGDDQ